MARSITGLRWLGVVLLLLFACSRSSAQCGPSTGCPSPTRKILYDIPNDPNAITLFFGGEAAGLALDPVNHLLYFAENPFDQGYAAVVQLDLTGKQVPMTLQPLGGFGDVTALTFYAGKLYVADGNGYQNFYAGGQPTPLNVVWQYDPGNTGTNGGWSQVVTGVNNPTGLAFDPDQNLYVSSWTDQVVYRYHYDSQTGLYDIPPVPVWTAPDGTAAPYGLAFDQGGNLYIAGFGGGTFSGGTKVFKVDSNGNNSIFFDSSVADPLGVFFTNGYQEPVSLAVDGNGYVYAVYYDALKIVRIAPDGSFVVMPGGGTADDAANGIAISPQGDLFTIVNGGRTTVDPAVLQIDGMVPAAPIVSLTVPQTPETYLSTFDVSATTNASTSPSITAMGVCTISGNSVTMTSGTGFCTLAANWPADVNYLAASATQTIAAARAPSNTTLSSSLNPAAPGENVTLTATVTSTIPGSTTGAVTFYDGAATLGSSALSGTQATLSTTSLSAGKHPITASYSGDANYGTSMSGTLTQDIVQPPPPVVSITVNEAINVGDTESFPDVFVSESIKMTDTVALTVYNTSVGTNVGVIPVDTTTGLTPVTVTFASVTQPGNTSLTTSSGSGPAPPAGFLPGNPPVIFDISTTATFTGSATVCINYAGISFAVTSGLRLFHYENGAWVDRSTSLNTVSKIACGTVASFSPFAIFQPTTQAPAVTSGNGATFIAGTPGSFSVTATGLPTPTLGETGTLPSGVTFNPSTGELGGTPAGGTGGTYAITITANNGARTAATQNFTLTVDQAPAITSASNTSFTFGMAGSFAVTASGFPTPTLSQTGLPSGVTFNDNGNGTATLTETSAASGTYSISITASNGVGSNAAQTFTLSVVKANQTITLTGMPSSATFGQGPFTITASASSGLTVSLVPAGSCSLSGNALTLTAVGSCKVTATQGGNNNYNAAPTLTPSFTIAQDATTTVVSASPATVNYSDYTSFSASVTPTSAGGQAVAGTVQFSLDGVAQGSAVSINGSGVATLSQVQVKLPAGNHSLTATFTSTNPNFAGSSASSTPVVTQENAFVLYTGDTIAQVGTSLMLRATVWDSAAAGYPGTNPETGPTATIGDITKVWIAFDVYPAGSCGSGTPSTLYAQAALTSTAGVGTAWTKLSSTSEVSYCVVSRLVGGSSGGTNLFYTALNAEPAGVNFYVNSGQFATGGGWVNDPTGSRGNFGFNARYNSTASPKGQMVYVYRSTYNGVLADFIIKSNALNALQFSGTSYPISATLQGKVNVQINRASDGFSLFSGGNYTFSATVTDSGQSGTTGKQFSLIVYDSSGVPNHAVPAGTPLQGGNVVVHLQ